MVQTKYDVPARIARKGNHISSVRFLFFITYTF